ncbi:ABC transporter ATP-binding protein [Sinorhizobium americanum]|uniref:High-affinity branched-chain amino acid transport ATP-binding protein LivF n=1 Tax=Sinorhizobium americanum TaxID=194963 RepID=A0A1L3LYU0_9HYPH|nr:ABC transporter ATP-binding protein [Sinorhizobium americanum]APG86541.1 high-affinity branched-chain amino acid transport ATP-binding protein LivF [Sinorhizobium americanum CCGM7]APG95206.1 high-affinity branched-chain amino acid transport ATP-binding protein LivF [Sinorhizobium americanum]OAP39740.1 ABC transporter ATP-binding protein [Sinorhizobium americanum]
MLEVKQMVAGYGRLTALKGVDITVKEGEVVFVVGPNGAGKSTLLKTISGLMTPTAGEIRFQGDRIDGRGPETLCRRGLALIPEGRHIFKTLTVQENLQVGAMIRKDSADVRSDMEMVLDTFPILRERFKGVAGYLSGGEQQQLAIARSILQRPALLMIDEPSLGLAPLVIDQVYDSLRKLNETGLTLLIVEQSTGRVMELASRIYVLRNGKVVLEGDREELTDTSALDAAYFGFSSDAA